MQLPQDVVDDVRRRVRRAAGQVQAVERMLADGRDCREVVTQLSASSHALDQAGCKLLVAGLIRCLDEPEAAAQEGCRVEDIEKLFMKLR